MQDSFYDALVAPDSFPLSAYSIDHSSTPRLSEGRLTLPALRNYAIEILTIQVVSNYLEDLV